MTPTRIALSIATVALVALAGVGIGQLASSPRQGAVVPAQPLSRRQVAVRLSGSPPQLAALHAQAGRLLDGGGQALRKRLADLKGYPLVINKWASWCQPCRAEFSVFQRAAVDMGRKVAFIGLDSGDSERSKALAFLRSSPVPYPSFYDPSGQLGTDVTSSPFTPVTLFVAPDGSRYPHQGPYSSVRKLERDVERYAIDA